MAWSWALVLVPVDVARTRLLIRMRVSYKSAAKRAPSFSLLMEPAHFVMAAASCLASAQRAEARPAAA